MPTKIGKYGNRRTNGYDSKREANEGAKLEALERAGIITGLRRQVAFKLIPKQGKMRACSYVADFVWQENGQTVVADAKGYSTEIYKLKKKLMKWVHGIDILEL